jgi:hypothetical protein
LGIILLCTEGFFAVNEGQYNVENLESAREQAWSARSNWKAVGGRATAKALELLDPDPGGTALKILLEVDAQRRSTGV